MKTEKFKCKICKKTIKSSDYCFEDYFLFKSLKDTRICEDCIRELGALVIKSNKFSNTEINIKYTVEEIDSLNYLGINGVMDVMKRQKDEGFELSTEGCHLIYLYLDFLERINRAKNDELYVR